MHAFDSVLQAQETIPGCLIKSLALQVVIVAATIAVALILFGLRTGDAASPALLAFMLALWGIAFFVALMAQQILPLPALPEDARRFFADSSDLVDRQRRLNNRSAGCDQAELWE